MVAPTEAFGEENLSNLPSHKAGKRSYLKGRNKTRAEILSELEDVDHHLWLLINYANARMEAIDKQGLKLEGREQISEPINEALSKKNELELKKLDSAFEKLEKQRGYLGTARSHILSAKGEIEDKGWPA